MLPNYEDADEPHVQEDLALVPVSDLRRFESISLGMFQKKMAFHLVCNLAHLDTRHTHPKVDAMLAAACNYLEVWFDGTHEAD
jgi:hypothetical protein